MQLNDIDKIRMQNVMRKLAKVLRFAFSGKSDIYIGFYALLTAQAMILSYMKEDCRNKEDFKQIKINLIKTLTEFQKEVFAMSFKEVRGNNGRH